MSGRLRKILGMPKRLVLWARDYFQVDRPTLMLAGAVMCTSGLLGGMAGYQGYRYAWIAPEFCYVCHIHDYAVEDWRNSIHGDVVTCHDCHRVPLLHYTKTFLHTFYERPSFPEDLEHLPRIPSETCESCHLEEAAAFHELSSPMPRGVFDQVVKVDESPAHVAHMRAESRDPGAERGGEGGGELREHRLEQHGLTAHDVGAGTGVIECIDCHGSEANRYHNFFARDENCKTCHEELELRGEHLSDFDCRHCHFPDFLPPIELQHAAGTDVSAPIKDPLLR